MSLVVVLLTLNLSTPQVDEVKEISRVHFDSEWRTKREIKFYTPSKKLWA